MCIKTDMCYNLHYIHGTAFIRCFTNLQEIKMISKRLFCFLTLSRSPADIAEDAY